MIYGDGSGNLSMPNIYAIRQSTNLYTYCMNNPIYFVDPSGNLAYPGEIHRAAVRDVAYNNLLSSERWLKYGVLLRTGRVDLVDRFTGDIWDVKPYNWPRNSTINQMTAYTTMTFMDSSIKVKPKIYSGDPSSDGYYFGVLGAPINLSYSIYDVKYWYSGNGIIDYSWTVNSQRAQALASAACMSLVDLLLILSGASLLNGSGSGGGVLQPSALFPPIIPFDPDDPSSVAQSIMRLSMLQNPSLSESDFLDNGWLKPLPPGRRYSYYNDRRIRYSIRL